MECDPNTGPQKVVWCVFFFGILIDGGLFPVQGKYLVMICKQETSNHCWLVFQFGFILPFWFGFFGVLVW